MMEFSDPVLSHLKILIKVFQWILTVHRRVLRVCYSYLQKNFERDTEEFYNTKITKVEVTVEGSPNELYA